jgi:hypothetical protein
MSSSSELSPATLLTNSGWQVVRRPMAPSLQYHFKPLRFQYRAPTSSQGVDSVEATVMQLYSRSNDGVQEYCSVPVGKVHVASVHSATASSGENNLHRRIHRYRLTSSFLNSPSKALDHARIGYALQTTNIPILVSPAEALLQQPKHTQIAFATHDVVMVSLNFFEGSQWSRSNSMLSILAATDGSAPTFASPRHFVDTLTERVQKLHLDRLNDVNKLVKATDEQVKALPSTQGWTLIAHIVDLAILMFETRRFLVDPSFYSKSGRQAPKASGERDILFVIPVLPRTAAKVQLLLLVIALLEPTYYTATPNSRGELPCIELSDALANVHGVLRKVLPPHGISSSCETVLSSQVVRAFEIHLRGMSNHNHRSWSLCKPVGQRLPAIAEPTCHSCLPKSYISAHTWHWPPEEEHQSEKHDTSRLSIPVAAAASASPLLIEDSQPMEEDVRDFEAPTSHTLTAAVVASSGSPGSLPFSQKSLPQEVVSQSSELHVTRTWSTNPAFPSQVDSTAFPPESRKFASRVIQQLDSSPQRPVRSSAVMVTSAAQLGYLSTAMEDFECTASELAPTIILSPLP